MHASVECAAMPVERRSQEPARTAGAWFRSLKVRDLRPELMDHPDVPLESHLDALRGLERINRISRVGAVLWNTMRPVAVRQNDAVSVLEIASGGGDTALSLARRAARDGVALLYTGVDISDTAVTLARRRASATVQAGSTRLEFLQEDVFTWTPPRKFDVVTCSLFLHHLTRPTAVELLRRMAALSRRLVVVNDLVRSTLGYWAAKAACPIVSRNHIVRCDGPQSVAAAFRKDEVGRMAHEAGLGSAKVRGIRPFRYLLTWEPSE